MNFVMDMTVLCQVHDILTTMSCAFCVPSGVGRLIRREVAGWAVGRSWLCSSVVSLVAGVIFLCGHCDSHSVGSASKK